MLPWIVTKGYAHWDNFGDEVCRISETLSSVLDTKKIEKYWDRPIIRSVKFVNLKSP
jgi:hypothetical protein